MNISKKINHVPPIVWRDPLVFIACGFGVGAMPILPGTCGTLLGVVFFLLLSKLSLLWYCVVAIWFFIVGIFLCDFANKRFGTDDHPAAVWDEIASFLFVMIAIPHTAYFLWGGFFLFRVFDMWKPWPIRWVDKHIHGGIGVMLDDLLAAIFSWLILFTLSKWL